MIKKHFYDIADDLKEYPDAVFIFVIGGRNTGKTYSALKEEYSNGRIFGFVKRTNRDLATLCAGRKIGQKMDDAQIDFSPFKSLNRDMNWNVHAFKVPSVETGGFWDCDEEGSPHGNPVGYIFSLHAVGDIKGFDVTDIKTLIYDEFIPKKWERVDRTEGDQLLDMYKTVNRGREHIGLPSLKLVCLANSTTVDNPTFNTFELTDAVVEMKAKEQEVLWIPEKKILVRMLEMNEEFMEVEEKTALYQATHETNWGRMAYDNDFGYDDFSAIGNHSIKGMQCYMHLIYKQNHYYIWGDGVFMVMNSSSGHAQDTYDLNIERDQLRFLNDVLFDIKQMCVNHRMFFKTFTMYNLIMNYKKMFAIR